MAEIVNVKLKKPPVESVTLKLSKVEAETVIEGLDAAQRGHKYYFNMIGGRSMVAQNLADALAGKENTNQSGDALSTMLRKAYNI